MTFILPLVIVVVYLKGYYDFFSPQGTAVMLRWMAFALVFLGLIFAAAMTGTSRNKTTNGQ